MTQNTSAENQTSGSAAEIRRMSENDLEAIAAIESESNLSRWGRAAYERELRRDDAVLLVAVNPRAAVEAGENREIVGFIALRLIPPEAEISNVAVTKEFRRQGTGARLLAAALAEIKRRGCFVCRLEARASNRAALRFYQSFGFEIAGRRKKYYQNPGEDALVLERADKPVGDKK